MRNGPHVIAWDVRCPSAAEAHAVRELLDREADLDAVVIVTVTGGGTNREKVHRLRDYFQAIHVGPCAPEGPHALRVVFQRLPNAGRYWRDLMVRLLRCVSRVSDGITITMAYRLEDAPSQGPLPESASVG
jgi:hypothetical protein